MRRLLLSLIPTAAAAAVVAGACSSGGTGAESFTTARPRIQTESTNWRTIPAPATTLTNTAVPIAGAGAGAAAVGEQTDSYEIVKNDFPLKIGKMFGCAWDDIAAYNEINKFPLPGTVISIPTSVCPGQVAAPPDPSASNPDAPPTDAAPVTISADGTFPYKVEENDTLSGIASNFDVSMQAIMDANPKMKAKAGGDPSKFVLIPGNTIKIPAAAPPTT